ncbi:probable serine/threonine-protein kinase kinX isoform X1 [Aotus nancymaae]|uniref:probable serine/threonine-protein kinase kinX isoform X1 n=2 Tax=Aotus nancymaae TaxID=37293 RepID=UPI0030FEDBA1
MSEHVRTRSQSSERENDEESSQPVEAVTVQQPTEEKRQGEEPPTETQGIAPSGEIENEGAPAVQEPDVEAIPQELALLKIEDESGDGPDIRMGILPTFDLTTVLEAVGNMSEHVRTRSQSSERENDEESSQPVEAVIVQQPTEEKRQGEEPPTETQGIAPSGEIENEGAPAVQEPDVEAIPQELALLKIEDESGDGPDIRMGILPTFDLTTVLEAVGNMSEHVRTRSQSSERENDEESSQPVEAVIVQQPTEEKRQGEEPPTETQGIAPSGEIENEGAPAVQEPDVEAIPQELALLKIEDESGDGPDIRMGILPTFDLTTVLEAVGNMSEHVRTRSQSSERENDEESSQPVEAVIVQQPTEEKRQGEEPPTETQGIAPSGEIENEGAPAVQEPDVEAIPQELALLKIEDESGDGPDIRMGILPTFDLTTVLEAVGNMSEHVRTRSQSSERENDEESSQPVEAVIVQQPTEEKRQGEEPPTETQGIAPSGEIENEGAPAVQEPDVEAIPQELALLKIEDESGDGPDIRMGILPTFDLTTVLEAGEGQPQVEIKTNED